VVVAVSLRVLGLDMSYAGTAIAATHNLVGPRLRVRTVNPGARRGDARLDYIVLETCEELRWVPDVVVMEGLFVGHNNNSLQLAELHGCIKRELYRHDVVYVIVAPSTLKVFATGDGRADKAAVLHAMRARYGDAIGGPSHIQTHDDADALAALAMGCHAYGQPLAPAPAEAVRALKAVKWPTLAALAGAYSPEAPSWDSIAKPAGALI
jgi:crossover junction endodeoxyribonuclease RuvC